MCMHQTWSNQHLNDGPFTTRRRTWTHTPTSGSVLTQGTMPLVCNSHAPRGDIEDDAAAATATATATSPIATTTATTTSIVMELLSQQLHPGMSIHNALRTSLQILESANVPEPNESVNHLLAHALNLNWREGHRQLREVLSLTSLSLPPLPPSSSSSSCSTNNNGGGGLGVGHPSSRILDLATHPLSLEQCHVYLSLLQRRVQYEPLQYIIGQWDFHELMGLKIIKPILCPRPETEELVELVLADIDHLIHELKLDDTAGKGEGGETCPKRRIRVLDVGCGTGAIGIAIAHRYPRHVDVVAIDVLPEAVELSNENAVHLLCSGGATGCASSYYQAMVCSANDFTNNKIQFDRANYNLFTIDGNEHCGKVWEMDFDIVVSNPPYIPTTDMQGLTLDVRGYESQDALCGGDDGLDVIRDIVLRLPEWLSYPTTTDAGANNDRGEGGGCGGSRRIRHCWMEVDTTHPTTLEEWLAPGSVDSIQLGVEYCNGYKDLYGRDRFVKLTVCPSL